MPTEELKNDEVSPAPKAPVSGDDGTTYQIVTGDGKTRSVTLTELTELATKADSAIAAAEAAKGSVAEFEKVKGHITKALLENDMDAADALMEAAGLSAEYRAQMRAAMKNQIEPARLPDEDGGEEEEEEEETVDKNPPKKGKKSADAPKVDAEARRQAAETAAELQQFRKERNTQLFQQSLERALDSHEQTATILKQKDDGKNPWPEFVRKSATSRLLALVRSKGFDPSSLDSLAAQAVRETANQMASFRESLQGERSQPSVGPSGILPNADFEFAEPFEGKVPNVVTDPAKSKAYIASLLAKELAGGSEASF